MYMYMPQYLLSLSLYHFLTQPFISVFPPPQISPLPSLLYMCFLPPFLPPACTYPPSLSPSQTSLLAASLHHLSTRTVHKPVIPPLLSLPHLIGHGHVSLAH